MMTNYFERPLQDEQLAPNEDEPGNAHCDDSGLELSEPCPHCVASYEREQQEEAKFLGI